MRRASEIAVLRGLGFSIAQIARVLNGDLRHLESALAVHQATLAARIGALVSMMEKVGELRNAMARGRVPTLGDLARLLTPASEPHVAFDLPWPWDGERFELRNIRPLSYITGPLGSGKTRLAMRLADALPGAVFLGLERLSNGGAAARTSFDADPALESRVDQTLARLVEDGGRVSDALVALLAALETDGASILVIDMLEQGLDKATQEALIGHLRRRGPDARPIFVLTRSTAILDLDAVAGDETIIFCPANHGVPLEVKPYPGTPGYEALASCLASPEVRARTQGVIAWRPEAAQQQHPHDP
jgi:hypothetical protein